MVAGYVDELKALQANSAIFRCAPALQRVQPWRPAIFIRSRWRRTGSLQGLFVQDRQQGRLGLVTARDAYQTTDPKTGERHVILTKGAVTKASRDSSTIPSGISRNMRCVSRPSAAMRSARCRECQIDAGLLDWRVRQTGPSSSFAVGTIRGDCLWGAGGAACTLTAARRNYGRLSFAILLYFIFMNLQRVAQRWLATEAVPAWSAWWLLLLMLTVAGSSSCSTRTGSGVQRRRWKGTTDYDAPPDGTLHRRHHAQGTGMTLLVLVILMVFFGLIEGDDDVGRGDYRTIDAFFVAISTPRFVLRPSRSRR